jgi:hypothetical protein
MLPRPRAAAREKGPGESAPQQGQNINVRAVSVVSEEITASAVIGRITASAVSAVNGGRALAPRGFVPRFRSLK